MTWIKMCVHDVGTTQLLYCPICKVGRGNPAADERPLPLNLRAIDARLEGPFSNEREVIQLAHDAKTLLAALRETLAKGEQLASAINAYIGCEAPPLRKNGPYWKALAPALGQWAAVRKKVMEL